MSFRFTRIFSFCLLASSAAVQAQSYVTPSDVHLVNKFLDQPALLAEPLKCEVKPLQPRLDFAFRFDVAFIVDCPVKEFAGEASSLLVYVRVTPEKGTPAVLGEGYNLPAASDATRARTQITKLKDEFEVSGAVAVGEGRYVAEVLVADKRTARMCLKRWNVTAERKHAQKAVPLALEPGTVAPMTILPWKGASENVAGTRVSVLLDAAPIFPFAQKLRAWDRSFLLTTLSSVLEQINCQSVKVIAFNLDQQKEIFRDDHFAPAGFQQLAHAMKNLELGTVSYEVLQRNQGFSELLAQLAKEQRTLEPSPDLVIFVGPQTHFAAKITKESLPAATKEGPPFFYLEFMPPWLLGREFPDSIEYITKALDGTSFKIHSPNELAGAMQKIALEVKHEAKNAAAGAESDR